MAVTVKAHSCRAFAHMSILSGLSSILAPFETCPTLINHVNNTRCELEYQPVRNLPILSGINTQPEWRHASEQHETVIRLQHDRRKGITSGDPVEILSVETS